MFLLFLIVNLIDNNKNLVDIVDSLLLVHLQNSIRTFYSVSQVYGMHALPVDIFQNRSETECLRLLYHISV
jgi:hypothetical protein